MKKPNGTSVVKLEKGIPLPKLRQDWGLTPILEKMVVGDSFRIPAGQYGTVRSMASMARKSIRTRKDGEGFIRVWCVAIEN